ncbi:MAG: DUF669 domain-containing protein [Aequoribacter sp.]|uniref:DUF669 domain-containing protein n=1 Tax=Aequoribacter sp. TaxID=2847771 RepID=UPI003C3C011D
MVAYGATTDPNEKRKFSNGPMTGWVTGEYVETERKDGKNHLSLTFEITEGEHKGRKVFQNLSLWYENSDTDKQKKVREFADDDLKAIMRCVGIMDLRDTDDICGTKLMVKLVMSKQKPDSDFEPRPEIKDYRRKPRDDEAIGGDDKFPDGF